MPDAVEDLLGTRVARLPGPVRRLLLAVALSARPARRRSSAAIGDPAAVDDAVDAGVLLVDGRARARVAPAARRGREEALALRASGGSSTSTLAGVVADEELRACHLALATDAAGRGARGDASRPRPAARRRAARARRRSSWPSTRCA